MIARRRSARVDRRHVHEDLQELVGSLCRAGGPKDEGGKKRLIDQGPSDNASVGTNSLHVNAFAHHYREDVLRTVVSMIAVHARQRVDHALNLLGLRRIRNVLPGNEIVHRVNRHLQGFERLARIVDLSEPLGLR